MNFVILGMGFVSERHLKAIKEVGGNLIAACDTKHDVVGHLDKYFPDTKFFTEFERLDRHCSKLIDRGEKIDYVSICSPNFLHDAHCRFALRLGANAICEKPLVLYERNLDHLINLEKITNKKIYTILQLRLNPVLIRLKNEIAKGDQHKVSLIYQTYRGDWYLRSWKSDVEKSGGLAINIGIHLFDVLLYLFGDDVRDIKIFHATKTKICGDITIGNADIHFSLSVENRETKRELTINNMSIELSNGFTNAHTRSYLEIMNGNGFGIEEARPSIRLTERIRGLING